ncbi:hypothetical protein BC629DRAFT_1592866 [Irpex lacteus]|nr:hypothetical protein BC629DRAFT_1592866 [Irpex lacteus]
MSDHEIDGLIDRLGRMSIHDPQYAHLLIQVSSLNPNALSAIESLQRQRALHIQQGSTQSAQTLPPPPPPPPFRNRMSIRDDARNPYLENMMCYGCGEIGHPISECLKLAELVNRGLIQRINGKIRWPNGSLVRRQQDELWVNAIHRQSDPQSIATASFATVKDIPWDEYYDSDDQVDYVHELEEGEEYERPAAYVTQYRPYESDYYSEPEAESYAAARPEKSNRESRKEQFEGVFLPARKEGEQRRAQARGEDSNATKPANRPTTRSSGPQPISKTSFQPLQQQPRVPTRRPPGIPANEMPPANRTQYRTNFDPNDSDQLMEDVALPKPPPPQPAKPRPSPRVNRNEPDPEPKERSARRSDIQNQVDSTEVLTKLLTTPVTLAVGEVLGVSREMSHQLQEAIKVKTTRQPANETRTSHPANANEVSSAIRRKTKPFKGELIKAKVYFHDDRDEKIVVNAIIDTGSQLNIVRKGFWQTYINEPRDLSKQITLEDANGGEGQLDGEVADVDINMGSLHTRASLFVGSNAPFDLLLGRPWQRGNLVSIDERPDGTYLIFKDKNMKPQYELAAVVEDQPETRQATNNYIRSLTHCFAAQITDKRSGPPMEDTDQQNDAQSSEAAEKSDPDPASIAQTEAHAEQHQKALLPIGTHGGRTVYRPDYETSEEAWEEYWRRRRANIPVLGVSTINYGDPNQVSWDFKGFVERAVAKRREEQQQNPRTSLEEYEEEDTEIDEAFYTPSEWPSPSPEQPQVVERAVDPPQESAENSSERVQVLMTRSMANLTLRHEQPGHNEPEILVNHPDYLDNEPPTPQRFRALAITIRDITNGEVIPETPQTSDNEEGAEIETNEPLPEIRIHPAPDSDDQSSTQATAGSSMDTHTLNSDSGSRITGTPGEDKENDDPSMPIHDEVVENLAEVSQLLRRLLQHLPINDPSRTIFHAAYHESTIRLVDHRLQSHESSRYYPTRSGDSPPVSTEPLTQDRLFQLNATTSQATSGPIRSRRSRRRRQQQPYHSPNPSRFSQPITTAEITAATALAEMSQVRFHEYVDDTLVTQAVSVRVEPSRNEEYLPQELLDLLRDMRDETHEVLAPTHEADSSLYPSEHHPVSMEISQGTYERRLLNELTEPQTRAMELVPGDDGEASIYYPHHRDYASPILIEQTMVIDREDVPSLAQREERPVSQRGSREGEACRDCAHAPAECMGRMRCNT